MPADSAPDNSFYSPVLNPTTPCRQLGGGIAWQEGLLVRSANWLGDILMCLPAVYQMRRLLPPGARLSVLCPQPLRPVWEAASWVDTVVGMPGKRLSADALQKSRALRAGAGVVLPNSFGSAFDLFLTGVKIRVGRAGRGRSVLLTDRLPCWRRGPGLADRHQVNHYLELAAVLGDISWDVQFPPLHIGDTEAIAAKFGVSADSGPGQKWLALAPGAAYGPAKQWPVEHFRHIAEWWQNQGGRLVVVGTGADQAVAKTIVDGLDTARDLTGKTGLHELMGILQTVDAVVANDSGAMHLAAALGTPGVAIFGSTDPVATGPLGPAKWRVLREPCDCSPCFQRTCKRAENEYLCLRSITPAQVIDAFCKTTN